MEKNSTLPLRRRKQSNALSKLRISDGPKPATIEIIRQYARCLYSDRQLPSCQIVLN
ncbi:hypothetical protein IMSAGC008_02064 [Muribaculaceae bacterium]|nr:hypothetical protein IMSAGC008_02064 [Muribaculaceae bacterium]